MKFENIQKDKNINAKVGDFIFVDGSLRLIIEYGGLFRTICLDGSNPCWGFGMSMDSLEELLCWYKAKYENFELIKSDEITLVRQ